MPRSRTFKAAILGSGNIVVKMTGLLTLAVLSRILTKTEYAAYRQMWVVYAAVAPALMLGLPQALYYFIPRDPGNSRRLVTTNLLLLTATGALFSLALWCGGNEVLAERWHNPDLRRLLLVFSPYALLAIPVASIPACLAACDKIKQLAIFNVASRIVAFVAVMSLVLVWRTPTAAAVGQVVGAGLIFVPALVLMYRATSGTQWVAGSDQMWRQIKYSIPLGLSSMLSTLSRNLDKVIVSTMCSPGQFALYANGAIELPVLATITSSVMAVLLPEFAALFKEKRHDEIVELWSRAMVKCALIIFPLMAFLMTMAREAMTVLFSKGYEASSVPFRIYLLLLPMRITTFGPIIMASGHSRLILVSTAVSLSLNLVLSVILTYFMGYTGPAVATVAIAYVFGLPFSLIVISRLCHTPLSRLLPYRQLGGVAAVSAVSAGACLAVSVLMPTHSDFVRLMTGTLVFGVVFIGGGHVTGVIPKGTFQSIMRQISSRGSSDA